MQATDEYLATRRARVVLADWDGVRALTTGAWLAQLGAVQVFVYRPGARAMLEVGAEPYRVLRHRPEAQAVRAAALHEAIGQGRVEVFDVESRRAFEKAHVPTARFAVPDRLADLLPEDASREIVLTSSDGVLASLVAAELAWRTGRPVRYLLGGVRAWQTLALPVQQGDEGVLTGDDDKDISPYGLSDLKARDAGFRHYLDWELGLVAQLARDGSNDFRLIPAS